MKKVCKKYGDNLPYKDGKILIENEQDIDAILRKEP